MKATLKKKTKQIVAALACVAISITFLPNVSALDDVDQFLLDKGVPMNLILELDEADKEHLYQNLSPESSFSGYTEEEVEVSAPATSSGLITPTAAPPSNKLVITLLTFNESPSGGYARKSFFPAFEWKQYTVLQYDAFSFSLGTGWYVETANQQLGVHIINSSGQFVLSRTLLASEHATMNGYGSIYRFPKNCGSASALYKGSAIFYAQKRSSSADMRLFYEYIQNNSGIEASISIPIGAFFSITILNLSTAVYNRYNSYFNF